MKPILVLLLILLSSLLFACQNTKTSAYNPDKVKQLYQDSFYLPEKLFHIETEEEIFQLDSEMLSMVETKLKTKKNIKKRTQLLLEYIFSESDIALSYSSSANLTASQTFRSQTANCISLTIMAYALAKEANLNVNFQQVIIPEYWVRNGRYNMLTGHINLVVTERTNYAHIVTSTNRILQIDFDPTVLKKSFPKKVIKKDTVIAMFYNNKGGDALIAGDYSLAYQYFKAATLQDKKFSSAWGNLGILYRLTDHNDAAKRVYYHAISLNENNLTALTNLAILLHIENNDIQANTIEDMLHRKRSSNPYYHAVLADEAFYKENYRVAVNHYKKAIKLDDREHEFYFGLAKVYYKMNELTLAKKALKKAIRFNAYIKTEDQYIAKLNFLNNKLDLNY
ncbi:MAG: tetratricopeptide repeat protein [Colwellia sp.]